ncbi:MAG: hypothetical protein GY874_01650 [Desulfobacteraceae bacterium]|nr:hypothetical protein [Desulfobacteraceae bacterium]
MKILKKHVTMIFILFCFYFLLTLNAAASDTVKVYLMAGQSNMEGYNTSIERLETLICLGGKTDMEQSEGLTCGSTAISDSELSDLFLNTVNDDYDDLVADGSNDTIALEIRDFLCKAGGIEIDGVSCGDKQFDLDDRLFRTISQYYNNGSSFGYGYNAFMEMSAAQQVDAIFNDGLLTSALLEERSDVKVLQFQGSLDDQGALSFQERYGNLSTGFGSQNTKYGPELMLGHYLADAVDEDVILLKVVQAGTDLRVDWKTPCSTANSANNFSDDELAQESLYDALVEKAEMIKTNAADYFPEYAEKNIEISGFVWFQGWNDGGCSLCEDNYETNLTCMISDLRNDLSLSKLPVLIIQSHRGDGSSPVQLAQINVAEAVENTALAVTEDLSPYYHFDSAAHLAIGARAYAGLNSLDAIETTNTAPTANDQNISMRAAELLARPITLAAYDADGDALTYIIVTEPQNGQILGDPPRVQYLPNASFSGQDSFTYKVSDGLKISGTATVTIDVTLESVTSGQLTGSTQGLFLHVPSHVVNADISAYGHTVIPEGEIMYESASSDPDLTNHPSFVSRNDLSGKAISIGLNGSLNAPLTISFKLIPSGDDQNKVIMQADAFELLDTTTSITSTVNYSNGNQTSLTNTASTLKIHSGNHFALVVENGLITSYLNGKSNTATLETDNLQALTGTLQAGPYDGKLWDIRVYERALSETEILELAGTCADEQLFAESFEGYPNYLCGVYVCQWWPENTDDTTIENYQHYLLAQDRVYERNMFEAGMYPEGDNASLGDYILVSDTGKDLMLSDGIRSGFVNKFDFDDPLTQSNAEHWLHENFHSFQGRLASYLGYSSNKFFKESTASWGANHNIPAVYDDLLSYYTLHPHLALWTIQSSPVDDKVGWEFKGGHQYGAHVFWDYLTNYIVGKRLIGDIFKDNRLGVSDTQAAFDLLADQGHDMKPVFADFAARITTWDIEDGEAYLKSEQGSLSRMLKAFPDAGVHDAKITASYDSAGTTEQWVEVPDEYSPGSWAFNAYKVSVTQDADYAAGVLIDSSNAEYADFQARIIVYTPETEQRTYHTLKLATPGEASTMTFSAESGDEIYLIVAATPDIFSGWDSYTYQYQIYPQ